MAHAYTPGLTVTERTIVRRKRLLPLPGTVLVNVGDAVHADSPVARAELPGKVQAVNVANLLGIAPDEIREYLVKREGEPVHKDEVIAENKPLIKWFKTEVRSPIQGTIESVSTVTGQVLLREPPRVLELLAYIDGTVVEVHPNHGVTIETACSLVQGIFGIGGETWGEITVAVQAPDETFTPERLAPEFRGKVVVCGALCPIETMNKAKDIGVAALIVGGIHDKDLRALLGYDLGVAITGTEKVGFTLILTEGFGTIPMAAKTFKLLSAHAGWKASVSGATQIRAGVIRPEIIIPSPVDRHRSLDGREGQDERERTREGIKIGDLVRIIRDPLFGKIGEVSRLPPDLQKIPTESLVRVLEVRFPDGSTAIVPRANIEVIEGA
ncbi:MAG TPA: hypothetical protein VNK46_11975 [Nitrospiraceae bacterium]|jgi:hypothetical protein|nr:hypothetical protein [Nitrospiraceae bacterium]